MVPAEKASLLGSQFDSKQCRERFVTSLSCFPQSWCNSLAFRTPILLCLLLDLDTYGGVDYLGVFLLFLNMVEDIITPTIFRGLTRRRSFPKCWQSVNVTAIPKGAPSPDRENYRPISITPILSTVNEKLISHKLLVFAKNVFFCVLLSLLLG